MTKLTTRLALSTAALASALVPLASTAPAHAMTAPAPASLSCSAPVHAYFVTGVDGPAPREQRMGLSSSSPTVKAAVVQAFAATGRKVVAIPTGDTPAIHAANAAATLAVEGDIQDSRAPYWTVERGYDGEGTNAKAVIHVGSFLNKPQTVAQITSAVEERFGSCGIVKTAMPLPKNPVVQEGARYVGLKYVWGGTSLTQGVDCSGFVRGVVKQATGKSLPRTAAEQASALRRVSTPRAGDLVFFSTRGHVHHVGIYVGGNYILHAPHTGAAVRFENFHTKYFAGEHVTFGRY